ncbi:sugar phosphate isomerase/epimerase [Mariniphaga sediminis]|uniref:Sugar phosphate isomerase/epimerase n=1 Tax=Mariniphaga sediminis TaxID=1628158 RepID=A0A399CV68_9BACT|nr:sugar phosphate isomerase/epimerase family protein [Mariniphaga sediminis]RIH63509.1 sugar phosphate isomerase/epimerase [Mariniphaga sediminis]
MAINRRKFLLATGMAAAMPAFSTAVSWIENKDKKNGRSFTSGDNPIGIITSGNNPEEDIKRISNMGFTTCQLGISEYSPELAKRLSDNLGKYQIQPNTLICMGPGPYIWSLDEGPSTIGLVPREYREERIERLYKGIDFCVETGIPAVHAHFGFIPEDPRDILYLEFVKAMRKVGEYGVNKNIDLYFETGQETPITLLRAIEDIGTGNLYVNLDPANLVMYGKANPCDGLKILIKYVRALHIKDGLYPTDPNKLGKEVPVPEGEVDFPGMVRLLKENDFKGAYIIECELSGDRTEYILQTKKYIETLILS